jgi:EpsD family peptidyl-prolyl cis-trans isomerase
MRLPSSSLAAPTLRASALALLCALTLTACGAKDDAAQATQVAAKVGSSEISVHQINQVLSRSPVAGSTPEALKTASREVLERLIDQQLAVDQATEKKLHRSPDVVAQLEAARREVLARAYLQQVAAGVAKAAPEEVSRYYQDNPALFAQRRVYTLQEIRIPQAAAALPALPALRELVQKSRPAEDVAALLREKNIPFTGGNASRTAEQLPLDLLPRLHALKDGQSLVIEGGQGATFIRIAASQQQPVSEAQAKPGIEVFLNNRRVTETVNAEMKRLREATTIAYLGDFERKEAPTDAPAPTEAPKDKPAGEANVIERGLQGLK